MQTKHQQADGEPLASVVNIFICHYTTATTD
jgi:hypothetical protein